MKLPFGLLPGSWGLKGKTREIARAEYELTGYEKDIKIAELKYDDDEKALAKHKRRIDLKYGKLTAQEHAIKEAEAELTGIALEAKLLEIEYEHSDMSENDFNKKLADIKGEPYIAVISSDYDPSQSLNGFLFEFDWNAKWIEMLVSHGYTGFSEDQIVQRWFEDLCRGVVAESMDDQPIPFNSGRVINRVPREGGKTDYS